MKIAIHDNPKGFSQRWIDYCTNNNIPFKVVNCYDNDIILQMSNCDVLMWHHTQSDYRDALFAKQLLFSLQQAGIKVFPDFKTNWHFDDKIGQKYLLEAIGAPIVPTYIFYTKKSAYDWIESTNFPKVFKLRGGAGSENVKLVSSKKHAKKLVSVAFGRGFKSFDRYQNLKERIRKYKEGKGSFFIVLKGFLRLFYPNRNFKMLPVQVGYVYFQDFIKNSDHDIRVIIIANKAFAIKRIVRNGDFRASGSGNVQYNIQNIPNEALTLAFKIYSKLGSQCVAFDFIFDKNTPWLVEISYGFLQGVYDNCEGYWDSDLNFHAGSFKPQDWMVETILQNEIRF